MPPTPKSKSIGPLTPLKVLPNTQQLCSIRLSADGKLLAGGTFEGGVVDRPAGSAVPRYLRRRAYSGGREEGECWPW